MQQVLPKHFPLPDLTLYSIEPESKAGLIRNQFVAVEQTGNRGGVTNEAVLLFDPVVHK